MVGPSKDALQGDYSTLISKINGEMVMFDEAVQPGKRTFALRHDIDHNLAWAVKFGMMEQAAGLRSTFFLLPGTEYFDYSPKFEGYVKSLLNMGHHIGFHNNVLVQYYKGEQKDPESVRELIEKPLNYLNSLGADVKFTAAHGDKICYEMGFNNYYVWREYPGERKKETPMVTLKEYGLQEAYFLKRKAYLSDSGGAWRGKAYGGTFNERELPFTSPINIVLNFNTLDEGFFQVLTHPIWWSE